MPHCHVGIVKGLIMLGKGTWRLTTVTKRQKTSIQRFLKNELSGQVKRLLRRVLSLSVTLFIYARESSIEGWGVFWNNLG